MSIIESSFLQIPEGGSPSWKDPVVNSAALPLSGNNLGDARVTQNDAAIHIWNGSAWVSVSGGGGITSLTGDVTGSGTGAVATTLATVNASPGTTGSASSTSVITTNGKGLVTSNSSTSIQIAESQVTNLVSDLAGKQATGNYITALTGDITASGPGSVTSSIAKIQGTTVSGTTGNGNVVFSSNATVSHLTILDTTITALSVNRVILTDSNGALFTPGEFNAGNSGTSLTLNWNNGPAQLVSLTGSVTLTLSNPAAGQAYIIRFIQDSTPRTVTWPASVKWSSGISPTISTGSGAIDVIKFYFDGTNYYGTYAQNFM